MITREDIERRFSYHAPDTDDKVERHQQVRDMCRILAHEINDALPHSREKSLALTHLEEVMMWSNASIAREGK